MDKDIKKLLVPKSFTFKERHVRWNCENSPESDDDRKLVRYHFVIVDDRFLDTKLDKIISNFQKKSIINYPFNEIRRIKGKVTGTNLDYLFVSYDTEYTSKFLDFEGVSLRIKKDTDLVERRKPMKIEDYVQRKYE